MAVDVEPASPGAGRATLRDLLAFAGEWRATISVALALGVLASLAQLAQPLTTGWVIDAVTDGRSVREPVALLVVLFGVDAILSGFRGYLLGRTAEGIVLGFRRSLIGHLVRLPVGAHDRHRTGDLLSRVGADTTLLGTALTDDLTNALAGVLTFAGAVVIMAFLDPWLLLVALLCVLLATASVLAVSSRVREADQEAQRRVGRLGAALERALSAIRTVKISRAEARETRDVSLEAEAAYEAGVRAAKLEAIVQPATIIAVQGSFVLVLGIGGARLASGAITLADLVSFLLYLLYLVGPLLTLFMSVTNFQKGLAALERLKEILAEPTEQTSPVPSPGGSGGPLKRDGHAVRFESVDFGYAPERRVLREVSFGVANFSRTALVGPSGAGKSTVFALLERFYEPDAGRILLDGREVCSIPLDELRGMVGYVEQDSPVMAGSIRENLLYAYPDATEVEIEGVLDLASLRGFVERLPRGLDTEVGDGGILLSGGERQRIAIARTLLARPRVMLLDEVTSQLDARNESALRATISRVSQRCTVMVVAHRLSTVVDADRIVVLDGGRVSNVGTHEDLIGSDALYRELVEGQLVKATNRFVAES